MIRHLVLIQFKVDTSDADIAVCMGNFEAIQHKIEGIVSVEWGKNNSSEGQDKGYTHMVFMTFVDEASRDHYLPHASHEALKAQLGPIMEDVLIFDYDK